MFKLNPIFDSLLLFIFTYLYILVFPIFPASTFAPQLYPLLFILLLIHFWLSLSLLKSNNRQITRMLEYAKLAILGIIAVLILAKTLYSGIILRHELGLAYPIHDNPIQLEEAIKFLWAGKNPYSENYLGTPLEKWHNWSEDPALHHFITVPFYLLFSLVISTPAQWLFGFFDQRMVHVVMFLISLGLIYKQVPTLRAKIFYLTLFIFNPLLIHYLIEGRNDIVVFTWVFLSFYYLRKQALIWAGIFFGLAFSTKQSAWLLLPLYVWYIYHLLPRQHSVLASIRKLMVRMAPFIVTVAMIFIPFLIWDAKSFIDDIYHFPAGNLPTSLEIKGSGFSEALLYQGIVKDRNSYYPFWIWQLGLGIPLLIFLFQYLKKNLTISNLIFCYMTFLCMFWLFSRFFSDNYVGYLSMLMLLGLVFWEQENYEA